MGVRFGMALVYHSQSLFHFPTKDLIPTTSRQKGQNKNEDDDATFLLFYKASCVAATARPVVRDIWHIGWCVLSATAGDPGPGTGRHRGPDREEVSHTVGVWWRHNENVLSNIGSLWAESFGDPYKWSGMRGFDALY